MENERFDEITKALTSASTRRNTLKALFGGTVASIAGLAAFADADARKKKKKARKNKKKKKTPKPVVTSPPPAVSPSPPPPPSDDDNHDDCEYGWDDKNKKCYPDDSHCNGYGWDSENNRCYDKPELVECVNPYEDCDYGCITNDEGETVCAEAPYCPKHFDDYKCTCGCREVSDSYDRYGKSTWECIPEDECPVACVNPYEDCCGCILADDEYICVEEGDKRCKSYGHDDDYYDDYGHDDDYYDDDYGYGRKKKAR